MAIFRLILLVAILGTLTLLLVQNWSPVLALTFLGMRTQALPLAIWILFSTAAGGITSLLISSLFRLSNYLTAKQGQSPLKSPPTPPPRANRTRREEPVPPKEVDDDWDSNSGKNDDWDFEEENTAERTYSPQNTQVRDSNTYERQQQPKNSSQSGSVYSYSYQEPKNSGVGKTESVYDADYRVIIPPYQPPTTKDADDDDWGFFDEDESSDKKEDKKDKRSGE